MRKFIKLLSVVVVLFAAFTAWTDPILGPKLEAMLPESVAKMPVIASLSSGRTPTADGTYGGIGAANSVAGAVVGAVSN